jgi:proline racemase
MTRPGPTAQSANPLTIRTIDAHAEGTPVRLIVEGFPSPVGANMSAKREWAARHSDHLRQALMLEPRGHIDMCGAVLTEAVAPGSHAGVLFMDNHGYGELSSHGLIAVTTIALERGLLMPGGDGAAVVFDTTAGVVRARASQSIDSGRKEQTPRRVVERVAVAGVPSFVLHGGVAVRLGARQIRADIAFGGAFYAIVDAESVGVPLDLAHACELRRAGMEITRAIASAVNIVHPLEPRLKNLYGTVFTGPSHGANADLRAVTVFAGAAIDRAPSGTGVSAILAVLDAIRLIGDDRPFVCEGIIGTTISGRIAGRTTVGEYEGVISEVEGSAWITGDHTFVANQADPLGWGFSI